MKKLLLLILTLCFTGISHASDSEEDLVKKHYRAIIRHNVIWLIHT